MKFQDLINLIEQDGSIFQPRKMGDRKVRYDQIIQQRIQDYINNGSKGNLDLHGTPIKTLPNNLKKVDGYLYLNNTQITSLPADLTVGGSLWLTNTQITSLPAGLRVGGDLWLTNTQITSLPAGLQVGGSLWLKNTPIAKQYTREQIKQMYPGIKGKIYT